MPVPRETTQVSSASSNISAEAYIDLMSADSDTSFGTLDLYDNSYTKDNTLEGRERLYVKLDNSQGTNDLNVSEYDYVDVTDDYGTVRCYFPAITVAAGSTKSYYVDSNGILYNDYQLTDVASPSSGMTTMYSSVSEYEEKDVLADSNIWTADFVDVNPVIEFNIEDTVLQVDSLDRGDITVGDKVKANDSVDLSTDFVIIDSVRAADNVYLEHMLDIHDSVGLFEYSEIAVSVRVVDKIISNDKLDLAVPLLIFDSMGLLEQAEVNPNVIMISQGIDSFDAMSSDDAGLKSLIVVDKMDFDMRGLKLVEYIELDMDDYQDTEVNLLFRYGNEGWRETGFRRVNSYGAVRLGVSGNEFKVVVRNKSKEIEVKNIRVGVKTLDKRFARGYMYGKGN